MMNSQENPAMLTAQQLKCLNEMQAKMCQECHENVVLVAYKD